MSDEFDKIELVNLHLLLFLVKKTFESCGIDNEYFREYENLQVSPVQIFRQRDEHREAIIKLCIGIMKAMGKEKEVEELCSQAREVVANVQPP